MVLPFISLHLILSDVHRPGMCLVPCCCCAVCQVSLRPGETPEEAQARRLRESQQVEERVVTIGSLADWDRETRGAGNDLVVVEVGGLHRLGHASVAKQDWTRFLMALQLLKCGRGQDCMVMSCLSLAVPHLPTNLGAPVPMPDELVQHARGWGDGCLMCVATTNSTSHVQCAAERRRSCTTSQRVPAVPAG